MKARAALLLALGLVAACDGESNGTGIQIVKDGGGEPLTVSGHIYGFTAPPDSTRIGIEGVTLDFIRIGDIVEWPDSGVVDPDSTGSPNDTILTVRTVRNHRGSLLDSIPGDTIISPPGDTSITPPDTTVTPPGNCTDGDVSATATTASDGSYSVQLEPGIYAVKVTPPASTHWAVINICSYEVRKEYDWPFNLYLFPTD